MLRVYAVSYCNARLAPISLGAFSLTICRVRFVHFAALLPQMRPLRQDASLPQLDSLAVLLKIHVPEVHCALRNGRP